MKKFMLDVRMKELDDIYDKVKGMYCDECDGTCRGCAVQYLLDAITEVALEDEEHERG